MQMFLWFPTVAHATAWRVSCPNSFSKNGQAKGKLMCLFSCQKFGPQSSLAIWGCPRIGVPPNHPYFDGIFQCIPSIEWGSPLMEITISVFLVLFDCPFCIDSIFRRGMLMGQGVVQYWGTSSHYHLVKAYICWWVNQLEIASFNSVQWLCQFSRGYIV